MSYSLTFAILPMKPSALIIIVLALSFNLSSQNDFKLYSNFLYEDIQPLMEKTDLTSRNILRLSEVEICEIKYLAKVNGRLLEGEAAAKVSSTLKRHNNFFEHAIDSTTNFRVINHIVHQSPFELSSIWVHVFSNELTYKHFDFIYSLNFTGNSLASIHELTGYINAIEYYHSASTFGDHEFKEILAQSYMVFDGEDVTELMIYRFILSDEGIIIDK